MNFPKFRIFDKSQNKYLTICVDYYTLKYQGDVWLLSPLSKHDKYWPYIEISNDKHFVLEQWTGLKDKNKKEAYNGDIVEFCYRAGDFAIQDMTEKEYEYEKSIQKEYIGYVSPEYNNSINSMIVVGDIKSTHMMFPVNYVQNGKIIGNINQNPELLNN